MPADDSETAWRSERQRTAIGRSGLSMPARQAFADGILTSGTTLLDYGCGRGGDVARLRLLGLRAKGWDPYYAKHQDPTIADVVLMSYVLNVIENQTERRRTLQRAWELAGNALIVSVRLHWDRRKVRGSNLEDGILTGRQTFQHLFSTEELRSLVQDVTGVRCVTATPGVAYVFRRERDRLGFIARSSAPNFTWRESENFEDAVTEVVNFAHRYGRMPAFEEIPADALPAVSKLSRTELTRIVTRAINPDTFARGARRTTLDTLLYLGIGLFEGRPRFGDLPDSVQRNIRTHFRGYRDACRRADRLLLKIRDDHYVRGAMRNSVGKLTPSALYVHRRAMESMPVVLRLYEHCGSIAAGRPPDWNVLKLHHDSRRVAWSCYPHFDADPHPKLAWTYGVEMSSLKTSFRSYEDVSNRPLLHRKHEFLRTDDPVYDKYERLARAEVRAGLYAEPSRIGLEVGWEQTLEEKGVELRGHRLFRRRNTP